MPAYRDSLRPWCQDGLQLDTHASTGDIFAFTLRKEFSNWSDRAGGCQGGLATLREPFMCSQPSGREQTTALQAGITWPSCCPASRAHFTAQAAGVTEGSSLSQLTQQERPHFQKPPRRQHIPRMCVPFAINH